MKCSVVCVVATWLGMITMSTWADEPSRIEYALALHGGAGSDWLKLNEADRATTLQSLQAALQHGRQILSDGGASLDVVEQVIRRLEDDPMFNAGRGAVFNSAGGHELDASIMDGRTKGCGAVAGVKTVKNPISLARLVMTETKHVLLAGDGADEFARHVKVEQVDQKYFWTQRRYDDWQRVRQKELDEHMGTVGCVALDKHGNLAAGTSTGGRTNKLFGRVGDSPIVGAGTYADNATCAVSCTGLGEQFIRHAVAYDISARMAYKGQSAATAVQEIFTHVLNPGDGGIIVVTRDGQITMHFNTPAMARAAADSNGRFEVLLGE